MKLKQKLYENLQTITLDDWQRYMRECNNGYIKIEHHQEDENIVILNYTELATFEKRWNKYTMSARGLILDLTDMNNNGKIYILARPFEKFFNYGENLDYQKDIDFSKITSVMEKMDGSLGISYFFNNEIRFATRGSFKSEQAKRATEIWMNKYRDKFSIDRYLELPYTLLVEIIYPENRVVVDYGDTEDLVLIGGIDIFKESDYSIFSPCDWSYSRLKEYANFLEMPIAKQYNFDNIEDIIKLKSKISANEEGWVIRFDNDKRLKIKGEEYINVHRVMHGLSDRAKVKAWADNDLEKYIMMLPEEFRKEIEDFAIELDKIENELYNALTALFQYIKESSKDRKEFAIYVNSVISKECRKFMFNAYSTGKISRDMIKDYIFKNYNRYIEVIKWKSRNKDF